MSRFFCSCSGRVAFLLESLRVPCAGCRYSRHGRERDRRADGRMLLGRGGGLGAPRGRLRCRLRFGRQATAHYEMVGPGLTGHAQSAQVTYDPRHISYVHYLEHNPASFTTTFLS
jgi:hypothetical protein